MPRHYSSLREPSGFAHVHGRAPESSLRTGECTNRGIERSHLDLPTRYLPNSAVRPCDRTRCNCLLRVPGLVGVMASLDDVEMRNRVDPFVLQRFLCTKSSWFAK